MKLNTDLLREIMLFLETQDYYVENDDGGIDNDGVWLSVICENFPNESRTNIFYTLHNLDQAGYICLNRPQYAVYDCRVAYITFRGHEFLSAIRDNENWSKVKAGLKSVKNYSLSALSAIADGITSAAINAYLSNL